MVKRAQASTEYLVLLGAALVVTFVVVGLLGFFPSGQGEAAITESQLYWKGGATPVGVLEAENINGTVCGNNSTGYRLVV